MIANWKTGSMNPAFEPVTGKSVTVPDQVLPLRTIVERFVRGDDVQRFPAVYDEDSIPAGFEYLSKMEKIEMAKFIAHGTEDLTNRISQRGERIKEQTAKRNEVLKGLNPSPGDVTKEGPSDDNRSKMTKDLP